MSSTTTAATATATPHLTFYLDLVSPYSYLSFYAITTSPTLSTIPLIITPVFLGGIMSLTSNRPPFATPLKGAYTTHDLHRQATLHKIPISPPASFPISTILAMRTLCVIQRDHPNKLQAAVAALYTAYWVEGKRIDSAAVVSEALSLVLSPELVHEMMEGAGGYGKEALTENTKVAVETGCFGLPWFVATDKNGKKDNFWGFDHLGDVARFLGVEKTELERSRL